MDYLNIELMASDGRSYKLSDFAGQKVVLYFYPKDDTSGCTIEAKEFSAMKDEYAKKGYQIIGVSRDTVKSHQNFIRKHELDILLLSDENEQLVKAFAVLKEKSMYGKKYLGIERSTFILNESGQIIQEYRAVSPQNHAIQILEEI